MLICLKSRIIYKLFNAEENLGFEEFKAEHSFYGVGAFEFLKNVI